MLCAISLQGVTGSDLRARAFFDANNVKVGDPLVLTIDFLGNAEFKDLHPPALSRHVDRKDWKLDDASAKTDTYRDARRLTYRIRPMREGVLWFPALEFGYVGGDGSQRTVRSNEIPVHAKSGAQVVVAEMLEQEPDGVKAPEIARDPYAFRGTPRLDSDILFAWKKACSKPTAEAFAQFDFPTAKMNEAACLIKEGNWSKALSIYRRVEWAIGQTPEVERGIVAALALKQDSLNAELPVWRQVLRPLLVFDWRLRAGIAAGAVTALVFLFWLIGRGIRALACLAAILAFVQSAAAQDPFAMMEEMHRRMQQQMNKMTSGFSFSFGEKEERTPPEIKARLSSAKASPQVGEEFEFILSLETPKNVSLGQVRLTPSDNFGLAFTGQVKNLTDGESANPSNVVKRMAIPARYDVPYRGVISFAVDGMASGRESRRGGLFSFSFSNSFHAETPAIRIDVKPLPSANQPADFSGIVSEGLRFVELCDLLAVETNDVITITYKMTPNGYVPPEFMPQGAAFEWTRRNDGNGRPVEIEYRRFFVADGAAKTPKTSISYYDPRTKAYRRVETGGTALKYIKRD